MRELKPRQLCDNPKGCKSTAYSEVRVPSGHLRIINVREGACSGRSGLELIYGQKLRREDVRHLVLVWSIDLVRRTAPVLGTRVRAPRMLPSISFNIIYIMRRNGIYWAVA